jgi:16S rRNA processing protein RimM
MCVVGKPHGVNGAVRINAFGEDPDALPAYTLTDRSGRRFSLTWLHDNVAELTELTPAGRQKIADRTAAEKLTNLELFTPRSALPEPEEEEFYHTDLIGLKAVTDSGTHLGTVAAIHDFGAGTSLEIHPGPLLIPFTRAAVPEISLAEGRVTISPPTETTL